jgi:sulfate permease family protein
MVGRVTGPPVAVHHQAKPGLLKRYLPILDWLPKYQRQWLTPDAVAALSVWSLLIPQALAYATIAGVPVQYGLYAAFAGLIAYAVFGTSRQLVQGPSGSVAAVSAVVVGPIVGTAALGTSKAVGYTAALALAAGAVYLLLGVLRMGWVSNFLSKAVLGGFVLGIIIDQSYKLLGVDKVAGTYAQELIGTIKEIPDTSLTTFAGGGDVTGRSAAHGPLPQALAPCVDRDGVVHAGREHVRPCRPGRTGDRDRTDGPVLDRTSGGGLERAESELAGLGPDRSLTTPWSRMSRI